MRQSEEHRPAGIWPLVIGGVVLGYLLMSRSFAYLGVPPLHVFIGEVLLAAILLCRPEAVVGPWVTAVRGSPGWRAFAWSVVAFGTYGFVSLAAGLGRGYQLLPALKETAFSYYSIFLFVGMWSAARQPALLERLIRALVWGNALYGTAYVLFLGQLRFTIPGADRVFLFGSPIGSAVALLGLVAFEWRPRVRYPLLLLNALVLLGMQMRAEWLGLAVGLAAWSIATRRIDRTAECLAAVGLVLAVLATTDFRIASPVGRGGEFSAHEVLARGIAVVSADVAGELSEHVQVYRGTANWRLEWWRAILASIVHDGDRVRLFFGHGLGFPLHSLVNYVPADVRSPHNAFLFALAYGGLTGGVLFAAVQALLAVHLLKVVRRGGQPFGLAFWALGMTIAFFSNFMETPFGAIPFYVITGLALMAAPGRSAGDPCGREVAGEWQATMRPAT